MKISYYSDIHLEFDNFNWPHTFDDGADVLVLAGDIGVKQRHFDWMLAQPHKHIIYVLGNHEYYGSNIESVERKARDAFEGTNVHFLQDGEHVIIDGVLFLGGTLWTDFKLYGEFREPLAKMEAQFAMNDFKKIRQGKNYKRLMPDDVIIKHKNTLKIFKEKLESMIYDKAVIVTHHAPSEKSIEEAYKGDKLSPAYASNLEEFMLSYSPVLWVHGHIHVNNDYFVGDTRVVSNPRGYVSIGDANREFELQKVIEV
jgi:Icc-related predicted phosphoesterase